MATLNRKHTIQRYTNAVNHAGAAAQIETDPKKHLLKLCCGCMLFEPSYYADGTQTAIEILETCASLQVPEICEVALIVNGSYNLRSVSTYLLAIAIVQRNAQAGKQRVLSERVIINTCRSILARPDMLTELFVQYQALAGQDATFPKILRKISQDRMNAFSEYQIAKYATRGGLGLKDVLRITHVKPNSPDRERLFGALCKGTLETPPTWEKRLSSGEDHKVVWQQMLTDGTLGGIAVLKNLRNMLNAQVDTELIRQTLRHTHLFRGALITQILAANQYSHGMFSEELSDLLMSATQTKLLPGRTAFLVDVSGSMVNSLAARSEATLLDAACMIASVGYMHTEDRTGSSLWSFSTNLRQVHCNEKSSLFEIAQRISASQPHSSTNLVQALRSLNTKTQYDRLVVITDEQHQGSGMPAALTKQSYIINVASYAPGIHTELGYTRINGFSPQVLRFINESEALNNERHNVAL